MDVPIVSLSLGDGGLATVINGPPSASTGGTYDVGVPISCTRYMHASRGRYMHASRGRYMHASRGHSLISYRVDFVLCRGLPPMAPIQEANGLLCGGVVARVDVYRGPPGVP